MYGEGISKVMSCWIWEWRPVLLINLEHGFYNGQRIDKVAKCKAFSKNPELANEIESAIRQNAGLAGDQLLDNSIADSEAAQVPVSPDLPE